MVAKRIKRQQRLGDVLESAPVRAAQFRHVLVETKVCHARIARWFCPLSLCAVNGMGVGGVNRSNLSKYFSCSTISTSCWVLESANLTWWVFQNLLQYFISQLTFTGVPPDCQTLYRAGRIQGLIKGGIQRRRQCDQVLEKLSRTAQPPRILSDMKEIH